MITNRALRHSRIGLPMPNGPEYLVWSVERLAWAQVRWMAWLWHSGVDHARHAPACFDNLPEQPDTPASICSLPKTKAATNHPPVIRRWEPANLMLNNWPTEIPEWVLNCSCHIVVLLEMFSFCDAQNDYFHRRVNIMTISIARRDEHFLYSQVEDFLPRTGHPVTTNPPQLVNGTHWTRKNAKKHWGYEKTLILYEKCFNNVHRIGLRLSIFDSPNLFWTCQCWKLPKPSTTKS